MRRNIIHTKINFALFNSTGILPYAKMKINNNINEGLSRCDERISIVIYPCPR